MSFIARSLAPRWLSPGPFSTIIVEPGRRNRRPWTPGLCAAVLARGLHNVTKLKDNLVVRNRVRMVKPSSASEPEPSICSPVGLTNVRPDHRTSGNLA